MTTPIEDAMHNDALAIVGIINDAIVRTLGDEDEFAIGLEFISNGETEAIDFGGMTLWTSEDSKTEDDPPTLLELVVQRVREHAGLMARLARLDISEPEDDLQGGEVA